ncbi:hypothetical protein C0991_012549, partial [Blastosporella zonata]
QPRINGRFAALPAFTRLRPHIAKSNKSNDTNDMANRVVDLFWGDDAHNKNPQDFFKSFDWAMHTKDDASKRRQFLNWLHSGSIAEAWFTGLAEEVKADWTLVEEAFNARWPPVAIAVLTEDEFEEALLGCRLQDDKLGLKEVVADREVWSHIAWANKMGRLAAGAGVLNSRTYLSGVRKALPNIIKDKLAKHYEDWSAFLVDVRVIDLEYIKGRADELQKQKVLNDAFSLHIQRLKRLDSGATTTSTILNRQLSSLNLNNNNRIQTGAQYSGVRPPPNAGSKAPGRVITADARAAFRGHFNLLPHHPATDAGRLAHQAQQKAWFEANPSGVVTELTPYPLQPGTASVNSSECFKCGMIGHISGNCNSARPLLANKQRWRAICANMLRELRSAGPVNQEVQGQWGFGW